MKQLTVKELMEILKIEDQDAADDGIKAVFLSAMNRGGLYVCYK